MSVVQSLARPAAVVSVALLMSLIASSPLARPDPADFGSTYEGRQLSVTDTIKILYGAGFRSESQLLTATSIAMSESSLYTRARRWHPEYGYRSAGTPLGVQGPSSVWSEGRQLHSDRGIFQISSRSWPQFPDARTDVPAEAAQLALTISRNGTDFSPWNVYTSGNAQRHWDASHNGWPALRPLVRQFLKDGADADIPIAAEEQVQHRVASGDTLYRLAARYYGTGDLWTRIADRNGITQPGGLRVGQVVSIP